MKKKSRDPWGMIASAKRSSAAERQRQAGAEDAENARAEALRALEVAQELATELRPVLELRCGRLAPGAVIPRGTLAMQKGGAARPFDAAGYRAGAKLLGLSMDTLDNGTGDEEVCSVGANRPRFERARPAIFPLAVKGDEPTEADVGGEVAVASFNTLKRTIEPGDLRVIYCGADLVHGDDDEMVAQHLVLLP